MTLFIAVGASHETIVARTAEERDVALLAHGCEYTADALDFLGRRSPGIPRYWSIYDAKDSADADDFLRMLAPDMLDGPGLDSWVADALLHSSAADRY